MTAVSLNHPWAARSSYLLTHDEQHTVHDGTRSTDAAAAAVLPCCGSRAWAAHSLRDVRSPTRPRFSQRLAAVWEIFREEAWQEAFDSHPRIGQQKAQKDATVESLRRSAKEQPLRSPRTMTARLALKRQIAAMKKGSGVSSSSAPRKKRK